MLSTSPVLIAVYEEWSQQLKEYLEEKGHLVVFAYSRNEVVSVLRRKENLRGIIIISDWAMNDNNDKFGSLIELVKGEIPSITIITKVSRESSGYRYMDEVYFPPSHEYVSAPFHLNVLDEWMKQTGM